MQKLTLIEACRKLIQELGTLILETIGFLLLCVVWVMAGSIVAIPYTFLARGTAENFALTAVPAPAVVFLLILIWYVRFIGRERNQKRGFGDYCYWGFVIYLILPILLNGLSLLLRQTGYLKVAEVVFTMRYASIYILPMSLLVIFVVVVGALNSYDKLAGIWRSSPPAPPNSPNGSPGTLLKRDHVANPRNDLPDTNNRFMMVPRV